MVVVPVVQTCARWPHLAQPVAALISLVHLDKVAALTSARFVGVVRLAAVLMVWLDNFWLKLVQVAAVLSVAEKNLVRSGSLNLISAILFQSRAASPSMNPILCLWQR